MYSCTSTSPIRVHAVELRIGDVDLLKSDRKSAPESQHGIPEPEI